MAHRAQPSRSPGHDAGRREGLRLASPETNSAAQTKEHPPVQVCTIVAANYIGQARVLARSLAATNPGLGLTVFVVDLPAHAEQLATLDEPGMRIVGPSWLPLADPREYERMATYYDVTEMSTAVKPWVLAG